LGKNPDIKNADTTWLPKNVRAGLGKIQGAFVGGGRLEERTSFYGKGAPSLCALSTKKQRRGTRRKKKKQHDAEKKKRVDSRGRGGSETGRVRPNAWKREGR